MAASPPEGPPRNATAPPADHQSARPADRLLKLELVEEGVMGRLSEFMIKGDVFGGGGAPQPGAAERDVGLMSFFSAKDAYGWCAFAGAVVSMLILDVCVLRRKTEAKTLGFVSATLGIWLLAGLSFNAWIYLHYGAQDAYQWFSGYLLEWILSFDDLFVFHLVFSVYKTPPHLLQKALFWGIIGAIIFRMMFFVALSSLFHWLHWVRYLFGALLIWSGISAAFDDDEPEDPSQTRVVQFLLNFVPIVPWYDPAGRLWVRVRQENPQEQEAESEDGATDSPHAAGDAEHGAPTTRMMMPKSSNKGPLRFTLLFVVICCLEITDIMFAADSVSAKVAQIPDQYLAYTSSVFAMFALRALFFIIEYLVVYFKLLKYGLCLILVFIGVELILADYVQLPASTVCLVLISVFSLSVALSALQTCVERTGDELSPPPKSGNAAVPEGAELGGTGNKNCSSPRAAA